MIPNIKKILYCAIAHILQRSSTPKQRVELCIWGKHLGRQLRQFVQVGAQQFGLK